MNRCPDAIPRWQRWFVAALLFVLPGYPLVAGGELAIAVPLSDHLKTGDIFMKIRLLGTLRLPAKRTDRYRMAGISALAWDNDEQILYALSDLGHLFHLQPRFDHDYLIDSTIAGVYPLLDRNQQALRSPWRDSEGLTVLNAHNGIRGDTELVVCFEVKQRINRYTAQGRHLGSIALPRMLRDIGLFQKPNVSLEAIASHPQWGILIAPEKPLRGQHRSRVPVIALGPAKQRWQYPLQTFPGSALVAMEVLADGSLLTLERAFSSVTRPLFISLRRTRLTVSGSPVLDVEDLAVFDTSKGWLLDNFEGLSHHQNGKFFIASDDNRSFLQNTLLVYFELL